MTPTRRILWLALELARATRAGNQRRVKSATAEQIHAVSELTKEEVEAIDEMLGEQPTEGKVTP